MLLLLPLAHALSGSHLATDGERFLSVWNGGIGAVAPIVLRIVGPDGSVSAPQTLPAAGICGVAWTGDRYVLGTIEGDELRLRVVSPAGDVGPPRTVGRSNDRAYDLAGWQCSVAAAAGRTWMAWRTCPAAHAGGCDLYDPGLTVEVVEVGETVTPVAFPEPRRQVSLDALGATAAGPILAWEHRPTSDAGACWIAALPGPAAPIRCDTTTFGGDHLFTRVGASKGLLWDPAGRSRTLVDEPGLLLYESVTVAGPRGPTVFLHVGAGRVRVWDAETMRDGPDGFTPRFAAFAAGSFLLETWPGELVWLDGRGLPRPLGVQPLADLPALAGVLDLGDLAVALRQDAAGLGLVVGDGRGSASPTRLATDGRNGHVDPETRTVSWRDPDGAWELHLDPAGHPSGPRRAVQPRPVPPAPSGPAGACAEAGRWSACLQGETVRFVDRAHPTPTDVPAGPRLLARAEMREGGTTRTLDVYADGRLVWEVRQHDCWGPQDPDLPICDPAPDRVERWEATLTPPRRAAWLARVAERDPALAADLAAMFDGGGPPRLSLPAWVYDLPA